MRKRFVILAGVLVVLLTILLLLNPMFTPWVEGPGFREMLDRSTSKGLKLKADYDQLQRVGMFGLKADSFQGTDGTKAIVSLEAQGITGTFNPMGMILRYWEIDSLHLKSGRVMLQTTEPTPGASKRAPWPPWWAMFWPYRVYLADVKADSADVLWKLKDKESGIYGTHLEITPNWKDFEYDAHGGDFKTPLTPPLNVVHAHILVRRPRLYCSEFILGDDPVHPGQQLRMEGDAGLQDDRSMHLKIDMASLKVAPWLPAKIRPHVEGQANGLFDYSSTGTGLETGKGTGKIDIANGVLRDLPQVHQYVTITESPDPGDLALKVCRADLRWEAGAMSAENIEVESKGVFRLTGTLTIEADKRLHGEVELGLTDAYIRWLPTARTAIFTRQEGAYFFATIHFSGTAQKPQQDLTERVAQEVAKSPLLAVKLFFNQAGEWFSFD